MRRLVERLRASVRAKLLALVLAPLMLGFPIIMGLLGWWGESYYQRLMSSRVGSDLATAHGYLERVIDGVGSGVRGLAGSQALALARETAPAAAAATESEAVAALLAARQAQLGLDFLNLLDVEGRVLQSSTGVAAGSARGDWPMVDRALRAGGGSAIERFGPAELQALSPALVERARLPLVATERALPDPRREEARGLVIHAAVPVFDARGNVVGVLEGGMLLNGNLDFVDTINAIVYRDGALPEGSVGTATLFLDDARIATNVRLFEGARALGTRASAEVRAHVLGAGRTWLETAFVVNDWYVSGYEPVLDSRGERVGMLYVGFLEAPFRAAKRNAFVVVGAVSLLISIAGALLTLHWARGIFRPIERMHATIEALEGGDAQARVGRVGSRDELGRLAAEFDHLLDAQAAQRAELQALNASLDRKVAERTADLAAANEELHAAQHRLVMSEKLAAIGELTAGVAHEISNPTAVIQGNLDLLRDELGAAAQPVANEIRLIHEQVNRIRLIVTKLLQFARPGEFAGYVETVDANAALADCLVLTRQHLSRREVRLVQQLGARGRVLINPQELQQVLINLIVNAVQAMPEGGTLTLETRDRDPRAEAAGVDIVVRDSGRGIAAEDMARIFDPFFTTKKRQGTGLGLSISHTLVERYGGRIKVDSTPGQGSTFTVSLLAEPEYRNEASPAPAGGRADDPLNPLESAAR
ncbi:MAG TPA: cache domain-containing protein [Thauera sp.]|uniref:sensor histidine kinase n=1 Tax=Thauera sp. TaxID=1905334 RepID=UPI002C65F1CC|nr:cache domain-containing protein [Thauera sp.]HRP23780.1 cache domain-containing protein [Thauera sp.]HRP64561.1 cache domain-containing protein [Thauera sp.]